MGLENPLHIAIVVIVILLVFGAKRLPEIGRSLGEGMRGFKDSVSGGGTREPDALAPPPSAAPRAAAEPAPGPAGPPPPAPAPPGPAVGGPTVGGEPSPVPAAAPAPDPR